MSPISPIPALRRLLFILSFSAFQLFSFCLAAPADDAEQAYQRLRSGSLDMRTLAEVLPLMADAQHRVIIRAAILEAKAPPRKELVALLQHPALAVRLGALELLEEQAGGDLSYNPWLPAEAPENRAAFTRWQAWVGEPATARANSTIYPADQRHAYLRDILGSDADKASRARRMLEAEGLAAVGFARGLSQQKHRRCPPAAGPKSARPNIRSRSPASSVTRPRSPPASSPSAAVTNSSPHWPPPVPPACSPCPFSAISSPIPTRWSAKPPWTRCSSSAANKPCRSSLRC